MTFTISFVVFFHEPLPFSILSIYASRIAYLTLQRNPAACHYDPASVIHVQVGPEQLAPRERVELADRNAQLENSRRGRRDAGAGAPSASRYGTRVNPSSTNRGFDDLEGYEQEVWIDPSRNLEQAIENPRNRQSGSANGSLEEGGASSPTEAELHTAVLFETAGGLGAKLRNTHLVGGERVKELDFFVASVSVPADVFVFIT